MKPAYFIAIVLSLLLASSGGFAQSIAEREAGGLQMLGIASPDTILGKAGYHVFLFVKNISKRRIVVPTYSGFDEDYVFQYAKGGQVPLVKFGHEPPVKLPEVRGLEIFKEVKYSPEMFLTATLDPGQHTRLLASIWVEADGEAFPVRFQVADIFSRFYGIWSGTLQCLPTVVKPGAVAEAQLSVDEARRDRVIATIKLWNEMEKQKANHDDGSRESGSKVEK